MFAWAAIIQLEIVFLIEEVFVLIIVCTIVMNKKVFMFLFTTHGWSALTNRDNSSRFFRILLTVKSDVLYIILLKVSGELLESAGTCIDLHVLVWWLFVNFLVA